MSNRLIFKYCYFVFLSFLFFFFVCVCFIWPKLLFLEEKKKVFGHMKISHPYSGYRIITLHRAQSAESKNALSLSCIQTPLFTPLFPQQNYL